MGIIGLDRYARGKQSDARVAEFERRLETLQQEYDEMVARVERSVQRGVEDQGVLAWCRARVDVPDEMPFRLAPRHSHGSIVITTINMLVNLR